ncbi:hypothetical protein Tco_0596482 [Tanacetum coccineum]
MLENALTKTHEVPTFVFKITEGCRTNPKFLKRLDTESQKQLLRVKTEQFSTCTLLAWSLTLWNPMLELLVPDVTGTTNVYQELASEESDRGTIGNHDNNNFPKKAECGSSLMPLRDCGEKKEVHNTFHEVLFRRPISRSDRWTSYWCQAPDCGGTYKFTNRESRVEAKLLFPIFKVTMERLGEVLSSYWKREDDTRKKYPHLFTNQQHLVTNPTSR